jgi:DNA polymerase
VAHNGTSFRHWKYRVQVPLSHQVDVAGFHSEATRLLAQQVPPDTVEWCTAPAHAVEEEHLDESRAAIRNRAARAIIPQSFIRMSELVVLHRDAQRFDLLYRSLWRLVYEPELKNDPGDADMARLRQMAQAVRRDIQKMKTRLEFRPLAVKGETVQVAWYEPAHHICEMVGAWLARRDAQAHWILLTPDRSLRWDGRKLLSAPALAAPEHGAAISEADCIRALEAFAW